MACPTGKVPHATREAALEHQKKLVYKNHLAGQTERSKGLNVYPCPQCAAWHVGHSEGPKMPLVYHYTVARYLDRILEAGELRPRNSREVSMAINEPNPLLWFSWNPDWEHSCIKDPRPAQRRGTPPTGRAITELWGQGLLRFGAPATVAKLRWNDYLTLNTTPIVQREMMAQRGNPVDWLATDAPVPLSTCKAYEVWMHGRWVAWDTLDGDEFDVYLEGRKDVYEEALWRLGKKVLATTNWDEMATITLDDDAEKILYDDYMVDMRQMEWGRLHIEEVRKFAATLPTPHEWSHGGKRKSKRKKRGTQLHR